MLLPCCVDKIGVFNFWFIVFPSLLSTLWKRATLQHRGKCYKKQLIKQGVMVHVYNLRIRKDCDQKMKRSRPILRLPSEILWLTMSIGSLSIPFCYHNVTFVLNQRL